VGILLFLQYKLILRNIKKVLVITYYWPPSGGAGVQRVLKFVKYLSQSGVEPIVLTVDEKKASYAVLDATLLKDIPSDVKVYKTSSFEPLQLFSAVFGKDKIPHAGFANAGKGKPGSKLLRFIRGNFFIPDARKGWVKHAYRKAAALIKEQGIDTVFISSPPHSSQLLGLKLRKQFGVKWIADMRDPWTDIYYYKDLMHTAMASRVDNAYEHAVLESADEVLVVSDDIKRMFAAKLANGAEKKIHVIPNGYDESDFLLTRSSPADKFLVTYTGTIAESYNPEIFFKTIKSLVVKNPSIKIEIHFVGILSASVKHMAEQFGLVTNCKFTSYVSHEEVIKLMMSSTCLLLVIPEVKNDKGILTGKLFEYLASRKPIIGIGPSGGDAATIIDNCKAGKMFDRTEEKQLEDYVSSLLEQWKLSKDLDLKDDSYKQYSRKELTKKLVEIIG